MKNEMRLSDFLEKIWYGRNKLHYPLIPFSLIYLVLIRIRRELLSIRHAGRRLPVPVIVVGGISVGGSGKTPLVIALSKWLKEQGYEPGIISRGYRGKTHRRPYAVSENDAPFETGDEALLIRKKTGQAVLVCPNRYEAAVQLLEQHAGIDVILADDGLQHYALPRDIEIAVVDGERRCGNTWTLPAGPLREPETRLAETDFVVVKEAARGTETEMTLVPQVLRNLADNRTVALDYFNRKEVYAVAGIANPQSFFSTLERLGMMIIPHRFPDHHYFQAGDFALARELPIVITEKDAVKCLDLPEENKREKIWVLETEAVLDKHFLTSLLRKIQAATQRADG